MWFENVTFGIFRKGEQRWPFIACSHAIPASAAVCRHDVKSSTTPLVLAMEGVGEPGFAGDGEAGRAGPCGNMHSPALVT